MLWLYNVLFKNKFDNLSVFVYLSNLYISIFIPPFLFHSFFLYLRKKDKEEENGEIPKTTFAN